MELMFLPLKRYADFEGRARRTEYWLFWLFRMLVYALLWGVVITVALSTGAFKSDGQSGNPHLAAMIASCIPLVLAWIFFLVPSIAVQARRFHDQNISGWLALLNIPLYIPYLGTLVGFAMFIIFLLPGTQGPNPYGPDPKQPEADLPLEELNFGGSQDPDRSPIATIR
jgi:uncharacterized membrane protein YhaH (DUF805 family)